MAATTATEAVQTVLAAVCQGLEWTVAEYWAPDEVGKLLHRTSWWSEPLVDVRSFIDAGEAITLTRGQGLPGRVWKTGAAAWLADVSEESEFARREAARDAGLHGALAVPVPLEGDRVGVLQFFTRERVREDPELLETMVAVAVHLGQMLQRQSAEASLRKTEQRLRFQARLLDAVGEAVIATDLDGCVLYWNAYAEKLYGWTAEEMLGRELSDSTSAALSSVEAKAILGRLRRGESWSGELIVRNRAGRQFPVLMTSSPITREDGRLVGVVGVSTDISERKRAEEGQRFLSEAGRVLASSLDYATTLRAVAELAVPTLGDWCIVHVLPGEGQPESAPVARAVPEENVDSAARFEAAAAEVGGLVSAVVDGRIPLVGPTDTGPSLLRTERLEGFGIRSLLAVPLLGLEAPIGVVQFAVTRSARRYDDPDVELAEELARRAALAIENARLYRRAEEGNRAKSDFLAVVSHELRTPLNAIAGYADLMQSGVGGKLSAAHARHVERIKVGARHLSSIIDEILAYARVESGRTELSVSRTDVAEIVREGALAMEPDARDKGLALRVSVPEGGLTVVTDRGKLRQIVINLLGNAIKYTQAGSIDVAARPVDGGAELRVRDTGIGIAPENLSRIFEPFWQAESPNTRTIGGTGLGLSVNRRLLDLLGGTIDVESEEGVGSTFTVWIPSREPETAHGR